MPTSKLSLNILDNEVEVLAAPVGEFERKPQIFIKLLSLQETKGGAYAILDQVRGVFREKNSRLFIAYFLPRQVAKMAENIINGMGR